MKTFNPSNDPNSDLSKAQSSLDPRGQLLAELSSIDGSHWQLSLHPFEYKRGLNPDLTNLQIHKGADNPFFNPAFLAASRDRVTKNKIHQMILWEVINDKKSPRLSFGLIEMDEGILSSHHLKTLTHPFAPLGDCLVCEANKDEIMDRFSDLLTIALAETIPPLVLEYISDRSPLQKFADSLNDKPGLIVKTIAAGNRASIKPDQSGINGLGISNKRRREFNRQLKKLSALGTVSFEIANEPFDVLLRFEEFLLMETNSWKGRRGSSIHAMKKDAAFARQAVNDLGLENNSEIFTLRLDNKPLASIIMFKANGCYYPWKITFDETYERYSPGSQLMLRFSEEIMQRPDFRYADSLAKFETSWMDQLWPSQTYFSTMIFANNLIATETISKRIAFKTNSKKFVKRLLKRT